MAKIRDIWDRFRRTVDDYPEPYEAPASPGDPYSWEANGADADLKWKNQDLVDYWNTTKREVCQRYPIIDRTTAQDGSSVALCTITLQQGVYSYPFSRKILQIRDVRPSWNLRPLHKSSLRFFDNIHLDWQSATEDAPREYIEDWDAYVMHVWPPPSEDEEGETLNLTVGRYPLVRDEWDDRDNDLADFPVLGDEFDEALVFGMMAQAFQKRDSDTFNTEEALRYDALFAQRIGPRRTLEQLRAEQLGTNSIRSPLQGRVI